MHCHNNQQLAFANTIEGVRFDSNLVDASLYGIGRGAGNCPLELIVGFLKNPKFNIEPILKVIEYRRNPEELELLEEIVDVSKKIWSIDRRKTKAII